MSTDLYRFYDKNDVLLYVGISYNALIRLNHHKKHACWTGEYANMTREIFDNRDSALEAEKKAIIYEKPLYNIVYNSTDESSKDEIPKLETPKLDLPTIKSTDRKVRKPIKLLGTWSDMSILEIRIMTLCLSMYYTDVVELHVKDIATGSSIYHDIQKVVNRLSKRKEIDYISCNNGIINIKLCEIMNGGDYIEYDFSSICKFRGVYSILLYEMMINNKCIDIELNELKEFFGCTDKYSRTNNFIQKVINPSILEINEYSDIKIGIGYRYLGRTISRICFQIL